MPVYSGYASQHGYGLGNVLGGMFRSALPIVGSIAKNAAKSAASTALNTGIAMIKNKLSKGKRKASATPALPAKRRKKKSTKRSTRIVKKHIRKTPPGKPVHSKGVRGKRKAVDIFAT